MTKPNAFLGLVKFFKEEAYLDKLIAGCFYCRTPESYRLEHLEGVSDKFESCAFSYRTERNDSPIVVTVNELKLEDVTGVTIHHGNDHDSWLHCWTSLRLPTDEKALESLKTDVKRMKQEFGMHYAYIPDSLLVSLVERLKKLSAQKLWCKEVTYSLDSNIWSSQCKSLSYSYQREFRFGFGECPISETIPYVLNRESGFGDIIFKNPDVTLKSKDGLTTWFDLKSV